MGLRRRRESSARAASAAADVIEKSLSIGKVEEPRVSAERWNWKWKKSHFVFALCLLGGCILLHVAAAGFGFCLYDDQHQIVHNQTLEWSLAPGYFVHDVWRFAQPLYRNFYRPVFLLWLLINWKLFAMNAVAWHLVQLLLHACVALLVWRLARHLLRDEFAAGVAGVVFAVHPAHVESAVWLSGSTEPLVAFFFLASFLAYLRSRGECTPDDFTKSGARVWWLLSGLLALPALFSKETALALPGLILLHAWWFSGDIKGESEVPAPAGSKVLHALTSVAPVLVASAIYFGMRIAVMQHLAVASNSLWRVLLTAPLDLVECLRLSLWPYPLALFYDLHLLSAPTPGFWLALVVVVAGAAATVWASRRQPVLRLVAAWWLLPLLPVLAGLMSFPAGDLLHDRYVYLSTVAVALLAGWAIARLPESPQRLLGVAVNRMVPLLVVTLAGALLTIAQTQVWHDPLSLFGHAVEVAPESVKARNLYANQLLKAGAMQPALELYAGTLRLDPDGWDTNFAYGVTLLSTNHLPEAEERLRHACEVDTTNALGYALLAETLRAEGRTAEARNALRYGLAHADSQQDMLKAKLAEMESQP